MLRRVVQVGIGSATVGVSVGAYALYSDRPVADTTKDGSLKVRDAKYPDVMHDAARSVIVWTSAVASKIYLGEMNNFTSTNASILEGAVKHRKPNQALITVSNHTSTVDDPGVLACLLPMNALIKPSSCRWSLCSQEYCYEKGALISSFFFAGKTLPIRRGAGIDHVFLEEFHKKVQSGQWVHIFPEGKIDQSGEMHGRGNPRSAEIGRFKWGVGKLIARADIQPVVIPIYHVGMDKVMPQTKSHKIKNFLPRIGQRVHVIVGDPIDFSDLLKNYPTYDKESWVSCEEERKVYSAITKRIEDALFDLDRKAKSQLALEHQQEEQQGAERHKNRLAKVD